MLPLGIERTHSAKKIEKFCKSRNLRCTENRKLVYELLHNREGTASACQILEEYCTVRGKTAPMTVYRALDFLVNSGLAYKVNSQSMYIACSDPESNLKSQFLICVSCGDVLEFNMESQLNNQIESCASELGYEICAHPIELQGVCSKFKDEHY